MVKHNLVFLLRNKLDRTAKAKEVFDSIKEYENNKDAYYLHKSLFALYDKKEQEAKIAIIKALEQIENRLPVETQDDWWRYAEVVIGLGYANWFLEILKNKSYDKILTPYYEAIKTFTLIKEQAETYLSTKALEIREATHLIIDKIKEYRH